MGNNIENDPRWKEITALITETSDLSGIPTVIIMKFIAEAVLEEQAGKPEEECRRIIGEKIDRYKAEHLAHATSHQNCPVKTSKGGAYHYTEQDKQRILTYRAKFADTPPDEQFYADNRIKTAIMNGWTLNDE